MNSKLTVILIFLVGVLIGQVLLERLHAYGEQEGGWSASEKRQVISLLERIEANTKKK